MNSRRGVFGVVLACLLASSAAAQEGEPPSAPRRVDHVVVGDTVRLSWRDSGGATYVVERAPGTDEEGGEFVEVGQTAAGETAFQDQVTPGELYRYRVLARDAQGLTSEPSKAIDVFTLRAPSDVVATLAVVDSETNALQVELSWTDPAPGVTESFDIERRPGGAVGVFEELETRKVSKDERKDEVARFTFVDENVDPEATYDYRISARKDEAESPTSAVATTPALERPASPTQLVAGAFLVDRIDLRWEDRSRNERGFLLERRPVGTEGWQTLASLPANTTSAADPVSAGAAYEYRVTAFNAAGRSETTPPTPARTPTRGPATLGAAGASGVHSGPTAVPSVEGARPPESRDHFEALPDRWRIAFPEWNRYPQGGGPDEAPYEEGGLLDPYGQNVLKGDYPVLGNDIFLVLEGVSDTLAEGRAIPIPGGVSTQEPRSEEFFGEFDQFLFNQNFVLSAELFQGDTAFRPKDFAVKVTAVANLNYVELAEHNAVNIDPREEDDRLDGWVGLQELLIDKHLIDLGPNYDFVTAIVGIQRFQSDFRGFLFADNNLGARLQANAFSNRVQANVAYFNQLEKDTNSGLNDYELRDQHVFVANVFLQDTLREVGSWLFDNPILGYTTLLNYHYNWDDSSTFYDDNDFLVRPAKIGFASGALGGPRTKELRVHYLGVGGDGHIGRLNLSHQYYLALGDSSFSEVAGRSQNILAHMFAIELSVDFDWLRVKGSYLYASGDRDPSDGDATGFSAIFDNPFFAGSGFSYFNRQNVPLVQTGVQLTNRLSLLPDMRSSKIQGQSNFVNPGLHLYNVGLSARVTPELFLDFNVNFLYFDRTEVLQRVLVQDRIEKRIGVDYNLGVQWRPLLTDNVIITAGAGALVPGAGFRDIYDSQTLYSGFVALTLTY